MIVCSHPYAALLLYLLAGTAKAALTEPSSSHYQPAGMSSSGRKKSAAGALQMPGQKQ